ncbi:uncharacterized protein FOMMEDRAFT_106909 [Fomitiporia mediterranea MF3/22]|uniref:uncharacterized protein n=1 Tax=Fomitiporia mediterranea (strain MF3/22) TaxID=694068 RepID=UPI0004408A1E|nr:uncharacterized protein FOMMEDRAFT_106909 [Fomitiporia mediterranea MF3/22]EJD04294.1 hypothetical protein FOMMEDRAFT_106909 [Fomitiporia mediterranea MF3/22]
MLLAMLNAKSAEDQRIASQLSLRRTMLEISRQTTESLPQPHQHLPYSHSSHAHGHGQHVYTYVPDEQYHHQQHHVAPTSPPPPHVYTNSYSSNARTHGQLRAVESPPLSSVTQKTMASLASRTRAVPRPHSRDATRPAGDARSQTYSGTAFETQPHIPGQSLGQNQRRKRARHSRSRSRSPIPVASSSSHRVYNYTYTRSPPSHSASHSHSHTEAELEPDRSPYSSASASDIGSPRTHQTRTMAIGSLLTAGSKARAAADHGSDVEPNERPNGNSSMPTERMKEERSERGLKSLRQTGRDHQESIERLRVYDRERNTSRG